jgi:hypothetical protein
LKEVLEKVERVGRQFSIVGIRDTTVTVVVVGAHFGLRSVDVIVDSGGVARGRHPVECKRSEFQSVILRRRRTEVVFGQSPVVFRDVDSPSLLL